MKRILTLATLLLCLSNHAQDVNHRWAVNLGVGALDLADETTFYSKFRDWGGASDDSYGIHGGVFAYIGSGFSLGVQGTYVSSMSGQKEKFSNECGCLLQDLSDYSMWNAIGTVRFSLKGDGELGWFDPFLYGDIGFTGFAGLSGFTWGGGAGVNFWFSDHFGITVATSAQHDSMITESDAGYFSDYYFSHNLGLAYRFGRPKDSDGDGIPDKDDACPDTPGPEENEGCPWPDRDGDTVLDKDDACPDTPGPVENAGCPWPDRDGDTVLDKDDACPDTPGPVENAGCPYPDRDGDSVLDKDDACPDTPGLIDNKGCPLVLAGSDKSIFFAFDSSELDMRSKRKLDIIAERILAAPENIRFVVTGYTDSSGSDAYNLALSERRATAVEYYLMSKGVPENRIREEAYGSANPIEDNTTDAGREQNRRVEIKQNKS